MFSKSKIIEPTQKKLSEGDKSTPQSSGASKLEHKGSSFNLVSKLIFQHSIPKFPSASPLIMSLGISIFNCLNESFDNLNLPSILVYPLKHQSS